MPEPRLSDFSSGGRCCRALDALHVASALALAADDSYTFNRDQAQLARAAGLRVQGV
jgi:hypothetical protein